MHVVSLERVHSRLLEAIRPTMSQQATSFPDELTLDFLIYVPSRKRGWRRALKSDAKSHSR